MSLLDNIFFVLFKQKTAYEMRISDWSSDVCSSDLNYRKADILPRQRAMLDFAMKVSQQAEAVEEADGVVLREHGFSDDEIWDIAAIAAFFGMSNRLANFTSLRPNDEFYVLGRG